MKNIIRFEKDATIIALRETGEVIEKLTVPEKEARGWVRDHGWIPLDITKTVAGETIIWVA